MAIQQYYDKGRIDFDMEKIWTYKKVFNIVELATRNIQQYFLKP